MPSPETKLNQFAGLWTSVDPFSRAPKGAFRVADNVMFKQPGLIESRRGYEVLLTPGTAIGSMITGLTDSKSFGMGWLTNYSFYSWISQYAGSGYPPTFVAQAAPVEPGTTSTAEYSMLQPHADAGRVRFATVNGNTYAITKYGLFRSEDNLRWQHTQLAKPAGPFPEFINSGVIRNGDYGCFVNNNGNTNGWLKQGYKVGYKFRVVQRGGPNWNGATGPTPNGKYYYGEPSATIVWDNAASYAAGTVRTILYWNFGPYFPDDYMNGYLEVYRTTQVPSNDDLPTDFYKAFEIEVAQLYPLDGQTATGAYEYGGKYAAWWGGWRDEISDHALGAPLETNPTDGDTAAAAFAPCPAAADLAYFKNRLYVGNYEDVQRLTLTLTGVGTGAVASGTTFTIDGTTFTWNTNNWTSFTHEAKIYTAGDADVNLQNTAMAMATVINHTYNIGHGYHYCLPADKASLRVTYSGRNVEFPLDQCIRATYVGNDGGALGEILLERNIPGLPAFEFSTSSPFTSVSPYGVWIPATSDPNIQYGGIRYSREGIPDSFPLLNEFTVGDPGKKILRLISTKDSLWVFKEDGLFRITDEGQGPSVAIFDPTIRLIAPDTVTVLNNEVYALCTQGVLRINEQGKDNISVPFQRQLLEEIAPLQGNGVLYNYAFGTAYETEGIYVLSLPVSPLATSCARHYAYFLDGKAWGTWSFGLSLRSAAVDPQFDHLLLGAGTQLWEERKDYEDSDYADPTFTVAVPAASVGSTSTTITFATAPSPAIRWGDYLQQTTAASKWIGVWVTNVSSDGKTLTLNAAPDYAWEAGNFTVYPGIQSTLEFLPVVGENELLAKTYSEHLRLYFWHMNLPFYRGAVSSDERPVPLTLTNGRIATQTAWGAGAWGGVVWGGDTTNVVSRLTITDESYLRAAELDVDLQLGAAGRRWELASIAFGNRESMTDRVVL